jgi:hypothetical protein
MSDDTRSNIPERIQQLWATLDRDERDAHLEWVLTQCATCGRTGKWEGGKPSGFWCDECCDECCRPLHLVR